MSRQIATILTLSDRMSGGILRASGNIQNMSREMRQASNQVGKMADSFKTKVDEMSTKALKFGVASAGLIAGLATKTGFSEAFDMEGYRVQLETATKDTQKASQLMSDAVKFANATPFETGEVVQATAKMEMYGLSSKRWLGDIADMAGSTNKSIDQATEAMADVAVGEFERIKEFGIKKDMILAESNKKYGKGAVINSKGQVVDQAKLMDVVQSMMQEKFKGGAEKLAGTTKGLWSTITGITKSSLANIAGMQNDGTIKIGSLLDRVKLKIKVVADQFQKLQDDGTIDKIAIKVTKAFDIIYNTISKVINFVLKYKESIINFAIVFASFAIAIKVTKGLAIAINILKIAWLVLNGTLAITPLGWILIGITALIAGFALLYKNNAKFREGVAVALVKLKEFGTYVISNVVPILQKLGESIEINVIPAIKDIAKWIQINVLPTLMKLGNFIITTVVPAFLKIAGIIGGILVQVFNTVIPLVLQFYTSVLVPLANFLATVIPPIFSVIASTVMWLWKDILLPLALFLTNVFQAAFEVALPNIATIFSNIFAIIGGIIDGATMYFTGIIDFITGIFTGDWEKAWQGVKEIFTGMFTGLESVARGVINGIINGINIAIRGVNKISSISGFFGEGLNIPEVPAFAKGTSSAPGGPSLVGENGPEIVNLKKGDSVTTADKTKQILSKSGGNTFIINFNGNVGTEEFFDEAGEHIIEKIKIAINNS